MTPQQASAADEIRHASQIARRALTPFGVVALSLGAPKAEVLDWLRDEKLWDDLSPAELALFLTPELAEQQSVDASWWGERVLVLVWALGKSESLPALDEQCNTGDFQTMLPPFADVSVEDFIATATRRPDDVLIAMADELLNSHWEARDAKIHGRPMPEHLNIEIIQERHHAINWVIGYEGLPWDEVTTDT
jgi:hypothetical protein